MWTLYARYYMPEAEVVYKPITRQPVNNYNIIDNC